MIIGSMRESPIMVSESKLKSCNDSPDRYGSITRLAFHQIGPMAAVFAEAGRYPEKLCNLPGEKDARQEHADKHPDGKIVRKHHADDGRQHDHGG